MNLRTLALAVSATFLWGSTLTLSKSVVAHFPPLLFMLMAYSIMAVILLLRRDVVIKTPPSRILLISMFAVTIQGSLLFSALRYLDATTTNLVLQLQVPAAVLLGWLINGEQMTQRKLIGTIIALAGVIIVIGLPDNKPPLVPTLVVALAGVTWALGQVLAQKLSLDTGMGILKGNALAGVPQLALATLLVETGQWQAITTATPIQWGTLLLIALLGFYAAYACWFALLRRAPMNVAAPFILLMTPFGLLSAFVVLGERMSPAQIVGAVVLLIGLAIINGIGVRNLRIKAAA